MMMKRETGGTPAFGVLAMVKWLMTVGLLATVPVLPVSGEPVDLQPEGAALGTLTGKSEDGGSAEKKKCYRCNLTDVQAQVFDCRVCDRQFCAGCAYLMRGDEFCCKVCAFAYIYPDEGCVYLGGKLQGVSTLSLE